MDEELEEERSEGSVHTVAEQKASGVARSIAIQSQPRIQGFLWGFWEAAPAWAGMRSYQYSSYHGYTIPEFPALCPPLPYSDHHTLSSLSHIITHTHEIMSIYLEVGRLCLVHSEPHENSKLEVIGERLSVTERRNPH